MLFSPPLLAPCSNPDRQCRVFSLSFSLLLSSLSPHPKSVHPCHVSLSLYVVKVILCLRAYVCVLSRADQGDLASLMHDTQLYTKQQQRASVILFFTDSGFLRRERDSCKINFSKVFRTLLLAHLIGPVVAVMCSGLEYRGRKKKKKRESPRTRGAVIRVYGV